MTVQEHIREITRLKELLAKAKLFLHPTKKQIADIEETIEIHKLYVQDALKKSRTGSSLK